MLVRAVARVYYRNIQVPRHVIRRARRRVPHHQAIRFHRIQVENRIEKRLALFQAGRFRLQVHRVRAEPRCGCSKADSRACRRFEKRQRHRLPAQRCQFFQGMLLNFLEGFALVEKKSEFVRVERFESQQIAEFDAQCPFSDALPRNSNKFLKSTPRGRRSEEHTSELQSPYDLVCRLLLEKKKKNKKKRTKQKTKKKKNYKKK